MDKIFGQNSKSLILRTFKRSKPSPLNLFARIGIHFLLYDVKLHEKKEKPDDPETLHSWQMGKGMKLN